jgi:hypothetical protein
MLPWSRVGNRTYVVDFNEHTLNGRTRKEFDVRQPLSMRIVAPQVWPSVIRM